MAELKKQRINSIDVAKGLGILFVVAGHVLQYGNLNDIIYSFSIRMPMFFMVSGMFAKPEKYAKFWDFLKIKLQTLICPYVLFALFGILLYACQGVMAGDSISTVMLTAVKSLGVVVWAPSSLYFQNIDLPLWFVPCLLLIEIMYYFLAKIKDKRILSAVTVLIVIFGWFTESKYCPIDLSLLPWSFCSACFALGFFIIGRLSFDFLKRNLLTVEKTAKENAKLTFIMFVLLGISISLSYVNGHVSIGSRNLKNGIYFYILGVAGAVVIFILAGFLENNKFLQYCGKHSFTIMASHVLINGVVGTATSKLASLTHIEVLDLEVITLPRTIIRFLIVAALSVLFTVVYSKVVDNIKAKRNAKKLAAA